MKLSMGAWTMWRNLALTGTLLMHGLLPGVQASFQSGPHVGAVYAASMAVDDTTGGLYFTGITYDPHWGSSSSGATDPMSASHCFVAKADTTTTSSPIEFSSELQYSSPTSTVEDACRSLVILSDAQVAVVGTADAGSLMLPGNTGQSDLPQVGFTMTLETKGLTKIAGLTLTTEERVPYPQRVVTDPDDPDKLFVASMSATADRYQQLRVDYPNWTHRFQHGKSFEMTVQALRYDEGYTGDTFDGLLDFGDDAGNGGGVSPSLEELWTKHFPVNATNGEFFSVYVAGMIWKANVGLIVAGSTKAQGFGYGDSEGDDEDGFVTVLDPSSGALGNKASSTAQTNERHGTAKDDFVTSLCDDPLNGDAFYIVGTTMGDMNGILDGNLVPPEGSLQAYVRKLNAITLLEEWTVQLPAWFNETEKTNAAALGCVVNTDGNLYVAGQVENGASMIEGNKIHISEGGQDIWIAQVNTQSKALNWIQQVGSSGEESMARNGGIAVDANGNAIVFGDTTGPLYREREVAAEADLFVITFDKDTGAFDTTVNGDTVGNTQDVFISDEPDDEPEDPTDDFQPNDGFADDQIADDQFEDDRVVMDDQYPPGELDDDQTAVLGNIDVGGLPQEALITSEYQLHQSGPNGGAMYASSLVYDPVTDLAVILGISYTSTQGKVMSIPSCLIAKVQISSMQTQTYNIFGSDEAMDSCRNLAVHKSDESSGIGSSSIIIVGNSEPGGIFVSPDVVRPESGFGILLNGGSLEVQEEAPLFSEGIPYPQALVVNGDYFYVASMTSNDLEQNANDQSGKDFPNWTFLNKYGKGFTMSIEKVSLPEFSSVWKKTYPVTPESDGKIYSIFVGGLIYKEGLGLVVVGSTRAKGDAYGEAQGIDDDGFITLIDPADGTPLAGRTNNMRIGSAEDDVIAEICDVPGDPDSVIVVGATKGDIGGIRDFEANVLISPGSLQWFVMRINLTNLREEWTIQGGAIPGHDSDTFYGSTSAYAVGCHVRDNNVFVAGTVENGASLLDGRTAFESEGGKDVWVASFNLATGNRTWMVQFGSVGDDEIARNGGITSDNSGNVIVFGDTTGALYRDRPVGSNADIFLAVLNAADGTFGLKGTSTGDEEILSTDLSPTDAPISPPVMQETVNEDLEEIPDNILAIQLGPDSGPSYAGGMDYDPFFNSIYLTGATYGSFTGINPDTRKESQCFFTRIDLPDLEVVQRDTYSEAGEMGACTAIAANPFEMQRNIVMLGTTEPGGLLTELTTNRKGLQYGFAMDLGLGLKFELLGGAILGATQAPVTFPVAVVVDDEQFWTVSMGSSSDRINPDYEKVQDKEYPNFTNGGVVKYGTSYRVVVESYKYSRTGDSNAFAQGSSQNFEQEWSKSHAVAQSMDNFGVLVAGMIRVDSKLVIVGSVHSDGLVKGIIAKIDSSNGDIDRTGTKSVEYFGGVESDTWIMNVCSEKGDAEVFYIVGATQESSSKEDRNRVIPWVAKIETSSLETVWTKKFYLRADNPKEKQAASFYACDVIPGENLLYLAGTVEDGAVIRFAQGMGDEKATSAGGDDIVVAQISTKDGVQKWIKQVGSNGNDRLARSGGVKVNGNGNAVVYGDTTGSFFRDRSDDNPDHVQQSDIFVMLFDKDRGIHQPPLQGPKLSVGKEIATEFFNTFTTKNKRVGAIVGCTVLGIAVVAGLFGLMRRKTGKHKPKSTASMYDADASPGMIDETELIGSSAGGSFGLFKKQPESALEGDHSQPYRDDPESADDAPLGLPRSFHKRYSDMLPDKGKNII